MYISCVQKDISINSIVDLSYILVIGQLTVNPAPRLATGVGLMLMRLFLLLLQQQRAQFMAHGQMPSFARKIITNCNNFN